MRGGLDDALDKLARRDELRRRAAAEATGTPPAVTELVEAIAAVVGRNPTLAVTVGVEGAGDPVLLHFAVDDGVVHVSADNSVASRVAEQSASSPRHADFDIDLD
jgi:flavoprotein